MSPLHARSEPLDCINYILTGREEEEIKITIKLTGSSSLFKKEIRMRLFK